MIRRDWAQWLFPCGLTLNFNDSDIELSMYFRDWNGDSVNELHTLQEGLCSCVKGQQRSHCLNVTWLFLGYFVMPTDVFFYNFRSIFCIAIMNGRSYNNITTKQSPRECATTGKRFPPVHTCWCAKKGIGKTNYYADRVTGLLVAASHEWINKPFVY